MKRKVLSILLAAVILIGVMPFSAFAGELPGEEPADPAPVAFIGQGGTAEAADDYTMLDEECCLWQSGTYVAAGDITLSGSASVAGNVNLILCDGAKLSVAGENEGEAAIYVPEGSTLNIYGQKGSSGRLSVVGGDFAAGIGGCDTETFPALSNNCGTVNIYGARVYAVGGYGAAGIGGGWGGSGGNIAIYGGTVTAKGDDFFGAGIGAGYEGSCAGTVTFAGGNTHVSGAWSVRCEASVSDDLLVYDFDVDQYTVDGWRLGFEGNPSVDTLIGSCKYFENGTEKSFPEHINIYNGEKKLNGGFYFVTEDFVLNGKLTAESESQLVLADGVTVDVTGYGRQTGYILHVYTSSVGNSHGRMPGGLAFDEQGKTFDVSICDCPVYNGETALAAGTYYVTENISLDEILTVTGRVNLILADGVTLDLRNGGRQTGSNLRILTESIGDTKGSLLPGLMYNEQGESVTVGDFYVYNGETELDAGTYFVGENYTVNGNLKPNGKVCFLIADGVTLKADIFTAEGDSSFEFYTESLGDEKGVFEGYIMSSQKYIDENGALCEMPDGFKYYNGERNLENGWYFVGGKGCDDYVTVSGTVHLVLGDGADVLFDDGIVVNSGNTLCIYAQSTGDRMGTAKFVGSGFTGIGSFVNQDCGTVIINGGNITAAGSSMCAGIGGCNSRNGGNVTINGGNVTATGGSDAAGIGGGCYGNGGNVTINGGTVTARGGWNGAGIGSGSGRPESRSESQIVTSGGSLTVNGGFTAAYASYDAAGIGGGFLGNASTVTVNGGTVRAYAGKDKEAIGAGRFNKIKPDDSIGSLSIGSGMVGYSPESTAMCIGPSDNVSDNKGKSSYFIIDGHYYDRYGTLRMMERHTVRYNGETVLEPRTYYVDESITVEDPMFVPNGVELILADGVVLNAAKGMLVTGDIAPSFFTTSLGENKGIFTGEIYKCYNEEGESGRFPSGLQSYNNELRLTRGYLVDENVTVEEPLLIDGNASIFLYDGVTFNAAAGYLVTEGSSLTIYTLSKGENKGTFIGEKLTNACEKTLPEYVKYYSGQTSPAAGWYYVQENRTLDTAMVLRDDVHFIIPDGVTLNVPKGIYMTESAGLDICPLSNGENAGQLTGRIINEYIDADGSHAIPDSVAIYVKGTTTLNGSYYLVLENSTVNYFSIPNENVTVLIADGVTLKGNAGYFGYEPNIGRFSTGENAGRFVGGPLFYLDENNNTCLVPSDAHFYNGETVLTDGIWFVGGNKTVSGRITVSGDVLLILGNGITFNAYRGITVAEGNSLTVTAQSDGSDAGKLIAYALYGGDPDKIYDGEYNAAIGGDEDTETPVGTVIIRHGYVEAHGFTGGAGIGCDYADEGGTIIISGGTVYAYGNEDAIGIGGDRTVVTIYGGNVFAYGDESGKYGGSGFGGENSVLNVLGGRVYACGKDGDCAVTGAAVNFSDEIRVINLHTNKIYGDTLFTGSVQGKAEEVLFFDASAVDENGDKVVFAESGMLYNGETVLEEDIWYYVTESAEAEDLLIFREGACMVLADGVTLNAEKGILCPASGAPAVYSTSNEENKGKLVGTLLLPYLDGENAAHALPDDASVYNGQTELADEWVYVDENHTLTEPLSVHGNVNIVLADGVTLDAAKGIAIEENGQLKIYFTSNGENKGVFIGTEKGYIDENGTQQKLPQGFSVYDGETVLADNWYFVTEDTVLDASLGISGDVTLVLADGVTLTANKGIVLTDGNSLTVYAQSEGENTGSLIAAGDRGAAGIGGSFFEYNAGALTVNGGNITALGGTGASGIGGGLGGSGAEVVINNGTLTVTGGSGAKAIGGGTGSDDDGTLAINESLAVEAGEGAQNITALEYDSQSFVKVTNHGEKYLYGIVSVSDGTAENITVTLTDTENAANVYNGETDGTNVYYVDNAANGTYLLTVTAGGAVTRTYTVVVTDGRAVKSSELYVEGDVNGDGEIDIYDYQQAVNIALGNENAVPEEGDLSDTADYEIAVADIIVDGYVDVLDAALIERKAFA